jgi:hypothetical protein
MLKLQSYYLSVNMFTVVAYNLRCPVISDQGSEINGGQAFFDGGLCSPCYSIVIGFVRLLMDIATPLAISPRPRRLPLTVFFQTVPPSRRPSQRSLDL